MNLLFVLCLATFGQTGSPASAASAASMPADESDAEGNKLKATPNDVHRLLLFGPGELKRLREQTAGGVRALVSPEIPTEFPFNDLLPSWNVDVPEGLAASLMVRLRRAPGGEWTKPYYLGTWGSRDASACADQECRHTGDEHGEINIDYFQSRRTFDALQYSILFRAHPEGRAPQVRRIAFAYSNTLDDAGLAQKFHTQIDPGPKEKWARRLPVPFRSQKWEDEKIRGSICSPTSTSMVLEYRGVKHPTVEVCQRIYDTEYRLYGNWWRAVQGAYSFGVPGYVRRFGDWDTVKCHIAHDQPVIASIKVKRGQLRNAPYRQSNGHLIVITGFTPEGDVCVNDPAAETAEAGQAVYAREDMANIWLANGGVGYILEGHDAAAAVHRLCGAGANP